MLVMMILKVYLVKRRLYHYEVKHQKGKWIRNYDVTTARIVSSSSSSSYQP